MREISNPGWGPFPPVNTNARASMLVWYHDALVPAMPIGLPVDMKKPPFAAAALLLVTGLLELELGCDTDESGFPYAFF